MNSHRYFVISALLLAFAAVAKSDCATDLNVTKSDWDELKKDTANPPEKILCLFKCEYEQAGALKADKTIDADKLLQKVTAWKKLDDPIKAELKECVNKVAIPLNTCADMKPYFLCVRKAENEQDNKPASS